MSPETAATGGENVIRGTVYGVLLNDPATVARLAPSFDAAPYKAAPVAPILYIKSRNTFARDGCDVAVPASPGEVRIDGTIGAVIGRAATRVAARDALDHVAGYVVVSDVTLPHESYYRPAIRQRCRDGFCPMSDMVPSFAPGPDAFDVAEARMTIEIDGVVVLRRGFADLVRSLPRLIEDISEFMTLEAGDVLLLGPPEGAPIARPGSTVRLEVSGLGSLSHRVVAEGGVVKRARVVVDGEVLEAFPVDGLLRLSNGRLVAESDVAWLPPLPLGTQAGTIFALGLNYAAHAKELAFGSAPEEPLVFLKGPNTLIGHRSVTRRPAGVAYMHYECELAVVIGKTCKHVSRERAHEVVGGYTVANDYAIRDYLENFYRPNLRVKNRDTCTPIGPWLVDAADVRDPGNLRLQTWVNGTLTQDGNTRDMVNDVPALIAHLSSFMTLSPGDVILTGTPDGVVDCKVGDEVVTEIEGIGRLVNTIGAA